MRRFARVFIIAAVLAFVLTSFLNAQSPSTGFRVTQLPDLPGSLYGSVAAGINSSGQIVGYSFTSNGYAHAVLWENGAIIDLGTLAGNGDYSSKATAINDLGQIVGISDDTFSPSWFEHAFLWERGTMTDLSPVNNLWTGANAINARGQILGTDYIAEEFVYNALLWDRAALSNLGMLTSGAVDGNGLAMNDRAQIAGWSMMPDFTRHAVLWENNIAADLGRGIAYAINNQGAVVGYTEEGFDHVAAVWQQRTATLLPSPVDSSGHRDSTAYGVNTLGVIVGYARTPADESHAVVWQNGVMTDLGGPGFYGAAYGINNRGQIVGADWSGSKSRALLWTR